MNLEDIDFENVEAYRGTDYPTKDSTVFFFKDGSEQRLPIPFSQVLQTRLQKAAEEITAKI